jgi:predicted dehydrogenase
MDKVRIGIIGIGGMGSNHADYLAKGEVPNAKLSAVCDVNPDRLKWAKENLDGDIKTFDDAEALFAAKCVDAVMIATPHYFHPPLAIRAFENDLHVLSEKPAGVYTKQVRQMNEAAEQSGKVFGIMFNQRTSPLYQKLRDIIKSGELGEIKRTIWIITNQVYNITLLQSERLNHNSNPIWP